MRTIRVTFDDGDTLTTSINGTNAEIERYYIGNYFNLGVEDDLMKKAVRVDFFPCECCKHYSRPGFILNAGAWMHCPQCNKHYSTTKAKE